MVRKNDTDDSGPEAVDGAQTADKADKAGKHPMMAANFLSRITYSWVYPLLARGATQRFTEKDLYEVCPADEAEGLCSALETQWSREKTRENPSFMRAILLAVALKMWPYYFAGLAQSACKVGQTQFLAALLRFFADKDAPTSDGLVPALGICVTGLLIAVLHHVFFFASWRCGMQMRVASTTFLYRHATTMRMDSLSAHSGQVINVISNDIERLQLLGSFLPFLVVGPIESLAVLVLLWVQVREASLAGLACLFLLVPLQAFFSRRFGALRACTAQLSDERIRLCNQIVGGISVVKMNAWEHAYSRLVHAARHREYKLVLNASFFRGANSAIFFVSSHVITFITLAVFFLTTDDAITAEMVFTTLSLLNLVQLMWTNFVPLAIQSVSEARVSSRRIHDMLKLPQAEAVVRGETEEQEQEQGQGPTLDVKDLTCDWERPGGPSSQSDTEGEGGAADASPTLSGVTTRCGSGELLAVVGPVGAGKSSLLMAVLREIVPIRGRVHVRGPVAYAAQEPWLVSATVRDNILFGEPFDPDRYLAVVNACALAHDFRLLPKGDRTQLGPKGVNLSGGQRARIGLARAAYKRAALYLLDDPLSAVDPRVARHLLERCVQGFLGGAARVLVTHQVQLVGGADRVLALHQGSTVAHGTPAELERRGVDLAAVADAAGEGEEGRSRQSSRASGARGAGAGARTRRLGSRGSNGGGSSGSHGGDQGEEEELVEPQGYVEDVEEEEEVEEVLKDKFASIEDLEEAAGGAAGASTQDIIQAEEQGVGTVSRSTYASYAKAMGGAGPLGVILGVFVSGQVLYVLASVWMARWSELSAEEQRSSGMFGVYALLVLATVVVGVGRALLYFTGAVHAARVLHDAMFDRVLRAPMAFFDSNPLGRVMNRFAKDIGFLDDMLPFTCLDFLTTSLMVLGTVVLVCVVNYLVVIAVIPLVVLFVHLRRFYLKAARDVKRVEATTRSPVFDLFGESVQGLATIRAFGARQRFVQQFGEATNLNTRAFFVFIVTSRWLGFRLDSLSVATLSATTLFALFARDQLGAGSVGLSVSYTMVLTGLFQWCVRQSAEVENQMVSVERVHQYTKLESEAALREDPGPGQEWPARGEVEFRRVTLRYRADLKPVLKGLDFRIAAGSKCAVVGRTGAGKSSIINALFRMVEIDGERGDGSGVFVDGVDTRTVGLHDLREKLSIIPQTPILFAGTIRSNLDPFSERSDDELWRSLHAVQLGSLVEAMPRGLDTATSEQGANLSVGQRQLLCLARAILRESRVLVMDEATANVDLATDGLIQSAVRRLFRHATVITIAHRLATIIDADQVIVLSAGCVAEAGHPHELLQRPEGAFADMVAETGEEMARELRDAAAQAYAASGPEAAPADAGDVHLHTEGEGK